MIDEHPWAAADDLAADATQDFLPEKDLPAAVRLPRPSLEEGTRPDPFFAESADHEILRFVDDAPNEFLSEKEILHRQRFRRAFRNIVAARRVHALLGAAALAFFVLRGALNPALAPHEATADETAARTAAAISEPTSDRPPAAADMAIERAVEPGGTAPPTRTAARANDAASNPDADRVADGLTRPGQTPGIAAVRAARAATEGPAPGFVNEAAPAPGPAGTPGPRPPVRRQPEPLASIPSRVPDEEIAVTALPGPAVTPARLADVTDPPPLIALTSESIRDLAAPAPEPLTAAPPAVVPPPWRDLLAGYRTAYERLDAGLAKEVWPAVDERALARAFDALESQTVTFDACNVASGNDRVIASCRGSATYVTRIGRRTSQTERRQWTFQLERAEQRWVIDSVEIR